MALSPAQLNTIYQNVLFRNADVSGIQFFANRTDISDAQVRQQIELSPEANQFVSPIVRLYQTVLGRVPDTDGLRFFSFQLRQGTSLEAVTGAILASAEFQAKTTATAGSVDTTDLTNTNQLVTDTFQAILGRAPAPGELTFFQGRSAASILSLVAGSPEATQVNAANTLTFLDSLAVGSPNSGTLNNQTGTGTGTTFTLTTGVDSGAAFIGGLSNDTFNATIGNGATLGGLDTLDGGNGTDTLNITSTAGAATIPSGLSIKNIENIVISNTTGAVDAATNALTFQGLQNVTVNQLAAANVAVTTQSNATSVSVNGGAAATIIDNGTGTGATKDVLSTVSLTGQTSAADIRTDALTSLSLKNQAVGATVTATVAAGATRALTLNLDNVGTGGTVTDNTATSVTVNTVNTTANATTPGSTINLTLDAATSLTFSGDKAVTIGTLTDPSADNTLTTISGASNTGGFTIGSTLANNVAVTGGSGSDTVTVAATTKAISLGAGDDTVNVTGALGTGGTLDGGTGTNTIGATAAVAATLTGDNTFAGKISNFQQLSVGQAGAQTTINLANLNNINYVKSAGTATGAAGAAPAAPTAVTTQGNPGQTESSVITFGALAADGDSVTVAGLTVTATGGAATAAQVEAAIRTGTTTGTAVVSGALTNFTVSDNANATDGTLVFTSTTPTTNVADISVTKTGTAATPIVTTTQGASPVTESSNVTFSNLTSGQSVTVAGLTATAGSAGATAAQIESAIIAGASTANVILSGGLTGFTAGDNGVAADGVVKFTSTSAGANVTDISTSSAGAPGASLTLNNIASGGTLELTGAIQGASTINVANAAVGTTDVFNIKFNGASNIVNTAALSIAQVETINISTGDTNPAADPTTASKVFLNAADATTVTVSGNHGIDFTGSTLTNLTTLNASGVAATGTAAVAGTSGAITFTSTVTNKNLTITTGNGNDVLSAASVTDATKVVTINGGAGNDTITGGNGADVLTGGTGNDIFKYTAVAQSTIARTDTITDFQANTFGNGTSGAAGTGATVANQASFTGDVIDLRGVLTNGSTKIASFNAGSAADAQTFLQNNAAVAGNTDTAGAALDSSTGNVYVDVDHNGTADMVIKLAGVTAVTNAAFLVG